MWRSPDGARVLVVEDDPTMALMILAQLGRQPCSVSIVENGLMAVKAWLAALKECPFDVVIMDIHMPVMSGETAMREIRRMERDLDQPRTPMVAFSAGDAAALAQIGQQQGFDALLTKPAQLDRLWAVLLQVTGPTRPAPDTGPG